MKRSSFLLVAFGLTAILVASATTVFASTDTEFTQVINDGVLYTDILDENGDAVVAPTVTMSPVATSTICQTPGSTGTFGTNTQRVYVDNPGGADSGWNLTIAATSGATATWENGGATEEFDFNDPTTGGCADSGDADSLPGQMTIDAAAGTVNLDCAGCGSTGITKGVSAAFNEGTLDAITIISASAGSDDIWRGYLTGADVSQTIPADVPADTYTIDLTVTATAL